MGVVLHPEDWKVYGCIDLVLDVSRVSAYRLLSPADRIEGKNKVIHLMGSVLRGPPCEVSILCSSTSALDPCLTISPLSMEEIEWKTKRDIGKKQYSYNCPMLYHLYNGKISVDSPRLYKLCALARQARGHWWIWFIWLIIWFDSI